MRRAAPAPAPAAPGAGLRGLPALALRRSNTSPFAALAGGARPRCSALQGCGRAQPFSKRDTATAAPVGCWVIRRLAALHTSNPHSACARAPTLCSLAPFARSPRAEGFPDEAPRTCLTRAPAPARRARRRGRGRGRRGRARGRAGGRARGRGGGGGGRAQGGRGRRG